MKLTINHHYDPQNDAAYTKSSCIIQVRHIRTGKVKNSSGGAMTVISAVSNKSPIPRIYNAKCSSEDQFSKRIGVLLSVQKMIWELIDKNSIIQYYHFLDGGKELIVGATVYHARFKTPREEVNAILSQNMWSKPITKEYLQAIIGDFDPLPF